MYLSEDYNSPQSPYWCLKSLIVVALAETDTFWTSEETAYPMSRPHSALVPAPEQILCNHPRGNHHFMLTPGQFVAWPMKASQAKYCKFAYSSSFGFSVPTGPLIEQIAPDSTLVLSRDGCETWAVKWKCEKVRYSTVKIVGGPDKSETATAASVTWYPWGDRVVSVDTTLIPPTDRFPDWHTRVHRVRVQAPIQTLHMTEGGFALLGRRQSDGRNLPELAQVEDEVAVGHEGSMCEQDAVIIMSGAGVSGLVLDTSSNAPHISSKASVLKPDSNTNLVCQRTLLPSVQHAATGGIEPGTEFLLVTHFFAISATANGLRGDRLHLKKQWLDRPKLSFSDAQAGNFEIS